MTKEFKKGNNVSFWNRSRGTIHIGRVEMIQKTDIDGRVKDYPVYVKVDSLEGMWFTLGGVWSGEFPDGRDLVRTLFHGHEIKLKVTGETDPDSSEACSLENTGEGDYVIHTTTGEFEKVLAIYDAEIEEDCEDCYDNHNCLADEICSSHQTFIITQTSHSCAISADNYKTQK